MLQRNARRSELNSFSSSVEAHIWGLTLPSTNDFPQADRLLEVGQVAIAVRKGHHADDELASFLPFVSTDRQGRYYRRAAELLGLIETERNHSALTSVGEAYSRLKNQADRTDFLAQRLIETEVFRDGLDFIRKNSPSEARLRKWFTNYYPAADSTAERRWTTYINFIWDSKLVSASPEGRLTLARFSGAVSKRSVKPAAGKTLTGRPRPARARPLSSSSGFITYDVDSQKLERANHIHWQLVDGKSRFLTSMGLVPKETEHIDLFASAGSDLVLYEMKSVRDDGGNLLEQVRKAVSQLHEYRYLYEEPRAKLCIVTNQAIGGSDSWILDYLAGPQGIAYEWSLDFTTFSVAAKGRALLGPFKP